MTFFFEFLGFSKTIFCIISFDNFSSSYFSQIYSSIFDFFNQHVFHPKTFMQSHLYFQILFLIISLYLMQQSHSWFFDFFLSFCFHWKVSFNLGCKRQIRSIDRSIDGWIDWLIDCFVDWFVDPLIGWFVDWFGDWLVDWSFSIGKWCSTIEWSPSRVVFSTYLVPFFHLFYVKFFFGSAFLPGGKFVGNFIVQPSTANHDGRKHELAVRMDGSAHEFRPDLHAESTADEQSPPPRENGHDDAQCTWKKTLIKSVTFRGAWGLFFVWYL